MSRARQPFRPSDLAKAVLALAKAGVPGRVEVEGGKMIVIVGLPASAASGAETSEELRKLL
jgi:hypothetical protein